MAPALLLATTIATHQSLIPRHGVPVQEILRSNNVPHTVENGKLTKHPVDKELFAKVEELAKSVDELFNYGEFYERQFRHGGVVPTFVASKTYLHEGMRSNWEALAFYSRGTVSDNVISHASIALKKIGWSKSEHLYWTLLDLNLHSANKKIGYKRLVALSTILAGNKEEWNLQEVNRYLDLLPKIAVYGKSLKTSEGQRSLMIHELLPGAAACKAISDKQLQELADELVSIAGTEKAKETATKIINIFRHPDRSP